jgi:DNA mismatch repair protein MutS2
MQEVIKKVEKEVLEKVVDVRKEKKIADVKIAEEKATYIYKINDRVRIKDSNSVGTIDKIEKKTVIINYGIFTTKTSLSNLELVESVKK